MKIRQNKTGFTLVEILVVVAIIAILLAMVVGIAARIDTQGKEQLTKNTIALLTAALGQFGDYGYTYSAPSDANLKFPLDCNSFSDTDLASELQNALGIPVSIGPSGVHDPCYSGCEAMYFFLNRVPDSRQTLGKIDRKLVTNLGLDGSPMQITVSGQVYPLFRVIDPWGKTLRYSYYDNTKESPTSEPSLSSPRAFPVITSAGPDKKFGTADDIVSR
jgi:prepilin-type N-terminal cleavage/methylation domain-containing protein